MQNFDSKIEHNSRSQVGHHTTGGSDRLRYLEPAANKNIILSPKSTTKTLSLGGHNTNGSTVQSQDKTAKLSSVTTAPKKDYYSTIGGVA